MEPTLVFDLGGFTIKAGLGGKETPDFIIPTAFPLDNHSFDIFSPIPQNAELSYSIVDGDIDNEDRMNYLFSTIFDHYFPDPSKIPQEISVSFSCHTQPTHDHIQFCANSAFYLLGAAKLIFQPPAFAASALFSLNCLVVDIGHDLTEVIPVINGIVPPNSCHQSFLAGSAIELYVAKSKQTSDGGKSDYNFGDIEAFRKQKEQDPEISQLFFHPEAFSEIQDERAQELAESVSLSDLITDSLNSLSQADKNSLLQSIFLIGGSSKFAHLSSKLEKTLSLTFGKEVKITVPQNPELVAWKGASIPKLPNICVTIQEYQQNPEIIFTAFKPYGISFEDSE